MDIANSVVARCKLLKNAYEAIKTERNGIIDMDDNNSTCVTRDTWLRLMDKLNKISKFRSQTQISILWDVLDENNQGYISK